MKKKLYFNTVTSLLLQVVTVLYGLILPRFYLQQYGSEINGLVQSITQFLGVITFLELGVGQVIQSALYEPLETHNHSQLSKILSSGEKFFRRIAYILLGYVAVLVVLYPAVTETSFDWWYTAALIGAMCISSFFQYYFGVVDSILLTADQRGYIQYTAQILTLLINAVVSIVLISAGKSIHVVKLTASLVFLLRPLFLRAYVNRHYRVNRKEPYSEEPIQQKWNGIAQHISAFILNGTDNIVLTVLSTLENVSVYSVYHMVVYGIHQVYQSATAGLHAVIGSLWAKQEYDRLKQVFGMIEMGLHFATVFLFTCTGILILPFIRVYTDGISDAEYIQPLFAVLIVLAHATQCIKTTYNMVILAGGHFKQVQRCHVISAALNMIISVAAVYRFGLVGVAVGTVISMTYQMVWMAVYDSKHLIKWPLRNFIKQILVDVLTVIVICAATSRIELTAVNYLAWFAMAVKVAVTAILVIAVMITVFFRPQVAELYRKIRNRTNS